MPSYKYEVIGPDGKPQTGTIDASNLEVATAELKSGGNTIVSLSKANAFNKSEKRSVSANSVFSAGSSKVY